MLDTTRAQAEAYLTARAIPHVEDSTNAADTYARNRVRHHAVPALESVNPAFVQHAADTAAAREPCMEKIHVVGKFSRPKDYYSYALP